MTGVPMKKLFACLGAVAVLLCTGCGPSTDTSTSAPVPTSTPTPSIASPTPDSDSARAAFTRVVEYRKVYDKIASDPKGNPDELATVARDTAYLTWSNALAEHLGAGEVQKGAAKVTYVSSGAASNGTNYEVTACLDVTNIDVIGKDGKSVVLPSRPNHVKTKYTMKKDSKNGVYYVVDTESMGAVSSC